MQNTHKITLQCEPRLHFVPKIDSVIVVFNDFFPYNAAAAIIQLLISTRFYFYQLLKINRHMHQDFEEKFHYIILERF